MKKYRGIKICAVVCLILGMFLVPANRLEAQAAEVIATVKGKIMEETTPDLLYLSTSDGVMQIKIDSNTDTSACKMLIVDTYINVAVTGGNDGYLHAAKITGDATTGTVNIDTASSVTVRGTLSRKTKGDILYVYTDQGDMQIKFDDSTSISGCNFLVSGQIYYFTCSRGSDAYLHATSISTSKYGGTPSTASSGNSSGLTPAPSDPASASKATGIVSGKVDERTTESILYLSTNDGVMQLKIDANTDARLGMILTPEKQVAVSFYRGSDAYLHAVTIVGVKSAPANVTIDSSAATVTGTVNGTSNEDILYLETQQGMMELKLDSVRSASKFKVLVMGKSITINCARGSDAYMHVIDIIGN